MTDKIPRLTITVKVVLLGLALLAVALLAAGVTAHRVVRQTQLAGVRDVAVSALDSLAVDLQSDYLAALNLKQKMSRQRRMELQDALETVIAFLDTTASADTVAQRLETTGRFIDASLGHQGVRLFIVGRDGFEPLYASANTPLPENMLDLLDESGKPVMLNFERSFQHDRQRFAWRAIYWSENNTHLACATVYHPLQVIVVASMSLDDIRIAFELRLNELQDDLSRVFNNGALGPGYTFSINSKGDVLSHPFLEVGQNLFSHLEPNAGARLLLQNRQLAEEQVQELQIPRTASHEQTSTSGPTYIFYRYYRPLDWFLVYAAPSVASASFATLMARSLLLLSLCLLPLAGLAMAFFGRSIASPLRRMGELTMAAKEQDICQDDAARVFVARNDEVGQLARNCSAMCKRLKDSERLACEELELVLENQWSLPYCRVDRHLVLQQCNSAFARLCGVDKATLLHRPVTSLPCSEFAKAMADKDRKMLQTRIPMHFSLELPPGDNTPRKRLQVLKTRLRDDVATFVLDGDNQSSLFSENLRLLFLASLGCLAAPLCREMGLPLGRLCETSAQLQKELGPSLQTIADPTLPDQMQRDLQHCLHKSRQFRELVQTDGESATLFSLSECVAAAVGMLQHTLLADDITVNANYESSRDHVQGDESAMRLALCGLLLNAHEALADHDVDPRFIVIDVFEEPSDSADALVLRIEDNGPGIALQALAEVKKPFFTTRHQRHALGLGLFYCDQLVQSMGGRLEISSRPNRGALLTMTLPRRIA